MLAASTAPSGAHRQPWTFALTGDSEMKARIREAAEQEERENYEGGRMLAHWREALEPTRLLGRPENERPFCMFPIGYPAADCLVPAIQRKALDEVLVEVTT